MKDSKYSIFGRMINFGNNFVTIHVQPYQIRKIERFATTNHPILEIRVSDGRTITPKQRDESYALISAIANASGYTKDEAKAILKNGYMRQSGTAPFSLSNTSETNANRFINYLITVCFKEHTPIHKHAASLLTSSYLFRQHCLKNHVCLICGKPALPNSKIPLCEQHNSLLCQIGHKRFQERYHLSTIYPY